MSALRPAEQSSQLVLILRSTVAITPFVYHYIFYNENNIGTCEIDAENDNLWRQKRPSFQLINLDDEPPLDRPKQHLLPTMSKPAESAEYRLIEDFETTRLEKGRISLRLCVN